MNCAESLVRCLENEGIEYVFGVPGEENAEFLLALEKSETIRFVLTRHEQGAGFMAAVYGRLTGNPAAALGTLGPGATNLITAVADANMDRAPLLVLTGQADTERLHKESHQAMDVVAMYEPVTKWAVSIRHPDNTPEIVRKAVRLARSEKPGAVLIELPEDIAAKETSTPPMAVRRFRRPAPDRKSLERAYELLCRAERPIVLAGNGAIRKRASDELRRFVATTGIGAASTFMGKGSVDRDDPRCLFTIGLQAKDLVMCAFDASDLVVTVGYDMVEYPPRLWNQGASHAVVHVDFEAAEIDEDYSPHVELIGDIGSSLSALTDLFEERGVPEWNLEQHHTVREQMLAEFAEYRDECAMGPIKPQKILWDVREMLGPRDLLISDVGAHKMWIARYYHCHEPNTCIIPNGFCSMGLALPGAIGASFVPEDRKVLAIAGDGGFLMNVQEMETAKRLDSDITVLVWEDGGYGLIEWKQDIEHGRHTLLDFGNPDWLRLAEAFGWHGQVVAGASDLRPALERALAHRGPSLVVAPVDYRENARLTGRLGKILCPI